MTRYKVTGEFETGLSSAAVRNVLEDTTGLTNVEVNEIEEKGGTDTPCDCRSHSYMDLNRRRLRGTVGLYEAVVCEMCSTVVEELGSYE